MKESGLLSISVGIRRISQKHLHDNVIKWKHFPSNCPFVRGIHRSRWIPTQRPVKRGFDVFFDQRLNKRLSKQPDVGDLRRHHGYYDVNVM